MTQSLIPAGKSLSECMMLYNYMDAIRDQFKAQDTHFIIQALASPIYSLRQENR